MKGTLTNVDHTLYSIRQSVFETIDTEEYSLLSSFDSVVSIGIIGDADGPTAIFIAKKLLFPTIVFIFIIISLTICLSLYWKRKMKNRI